MKRHAYCIIAHTEPVVLQALVDCIDDERNDIFILIDRKSQCEGIRAVHANSSHLVYVEEQAIYWGDVSQVGAELSLLGAARRSGTYAQYHLLSGLDMPLMSQDAIHQLCDEKYPDRNFVAVEDASSDRAHDRLAYYYLFTKYNAVSSSRLSGLGRRVKDGFVAWQKKIGFSRIGTLEVRLGSNWASLSNSFVEYLLSRKREIFSRYRMSSCPDEMYKQTEIWNSPFRSTIFDGVKPEFANLRAIDWKRGNPYVWRFEDLDFLLHSGMMFARKVTSGDPRLLAALVKSATSR